MRCKSCDSMFEVTDDNLYELCTICHNIAEKADFWPSDKEYHHQNAIEGETSMYKNME